VKHRLARLIGPIQRLIDQRDALGAKVKVLEAELEQCRGAGGEIPPHFSAAPDLADVRARRDKIFAVPKTLPQIDLSEQAQLELVETLSPYARDAGLCETATPGHRYCFTNEFFTYGDAVVHQAMLRWLRPRRLVEIGSGYSSALILDTNERHLNNSLRCTFVEPWPDRLLGLLSDTDRATTEILVSPLQDVDLAFLDDLEAGDVFFVDSSHISRIGSDVNQLVFEVLPRIKPGVFVHFHDIFYPFEYPEVWVNEGRGWNEAYLLRAYLQSNDGFRIRLWNSYLAAFHQSEVSSKLPDWGRNSGGSLWLERV